MSKSKTILQLISGTLILSAIALYNGYPFVYSDTGTYIYSGFDKFIPLDRPVTYGLFLWMASFGQSAWFVIIIQNLIASFVLLKTIQLFKFTKEHFSRIYYFIILFLVLFTGIGWYTNQLMPDFFAAISILVFFTINQKEKLFDLSGIMLILILILSVISHFSHLLLVSVLIAITLLVRTFTDLLSHISLKRILIVTSIVLSSWFIIPTINYAIEKKFILSKGTHVFLMAHLNDAGILQKFLNEKCLEEDFKNCSICNLRDSLPNDLASFIWSSNIIDKSGGWLESKTEYDKIINATLTDPNYLYLNIYRSFTYGLTQLTKNEIGEGLSAYGEGSPPHGQIYWRFNDEINNYLNSRQNQWNGINLNRNFVNTAQTIVLIISLFVLVLLFSGSSLQRFDKSQRMFLLFIVFSILANSFITAGLNSPCSRFQARVVWLLPFAILIIGLKNYKQIPILRNNIQIRTDD